MLRESNQVGAWVDQINIPKGGRVLAHTHLHHEVLTVIEGTWYLGEGERFDPDKLNGYPAGSFIVIPDFLAAKDEVILQRSGTGKFRTEYLEK